MTTGVGGEQTPSATFDELLGEAIHQELWRRRIKQTQFAQRALGITQSALSNKLRGKRPFTAEELTCIADALRLDLNKITPRKNPPTGGGDDGGSTGPTPTSGKSS